MTERIKRNHMHAARIVIVAVLLLSALFLFAACKPDPDPDDPFVVIEYEKPADLPDYALTLEWVGGAYSPLKPSMILLNGKGKYDEKETFTLPSDIYTYGSSGDYAVLHSYAQHMNLNLASYWRTMGFNVAIFHYESFADDTQEGLNKKIYNAASMQYINKNGERIVSDLPAYNLTEAFVMAWMKHFTANPTNGSSSTNRVMELRFVGNGAGANLAVSAAEYLYNEFKKGRISGAAVPNRVTLTNPYLDNTVNNLSVSHAEGGTVSSVLAYTENAMRTLSAGGVLFETIESNAEHFNRYNAPYSGLVDFVAQEGAAATDDDPEKMLGDTGDSLLYKNLMQHTAYLTFTETFSNRYPASYKELDRAARDWYLYSVNGSDDTSLSSNSNTVLGPNGTYPMWDNRSSNAGYSLLRCAVSAWTPTTYVAVQQGQHYRFMRSDWNSSEGIYELKPYTMSLFSAENYQVSNLEGAIVAGYVYWRKDNTDQVNFDYATRLANVEVRVVATLDNTEKVFTAHSDASGFYQMTIPTAYYEAELAISVIPPKGYSLSSAPSFERQYDKMSVTTVTATSTLTSDLTISAGQQQTIIKNAGLTKNS